MILDQVKLKDPKTGRRRPWCIAIGVLIAVIIIVVIVVPLAVLLPRRHHKGETSTILFPLYIYPETNTTWDPLFKQITTYPKLNFTVIVNPSSGPGNTSVPSDAYVEQVQRLNAYPNVRTVGYVRTAYDSRNVTAVLKDVETYSNWASNSSTLAMHGIFFDEVPSMYNNSNAHFLATVNKAAKSAEGLQSDRLVIHNPGAIPDPRYRDANTDVTVVFEQSYALYADRKIELAELHPNRTSYSYMVHSVPEMGNASLASYVQGLSQRAEYIFVTSLTQEYYESFDPRLDEFCAVVPKRK